MSFLRSVIRKITVLCRRPIHFHVNRVIHVNKVSGKAWNAQIIRYFSQTIMEKEVNFEELQQQLNNNDVILIDVRNPDEIKEAGKIAKSINIPLGKVKEALQLSNEEFEKVYKVKKPSSKDNIVMHCHAGKRAVMATDIAKELGINARPYKGSFTDWVAKGGPVTH